MTSLNSYVDGAFADGIITEAEAKAIEKYLNTVNTSKDSVTATYTKLYSNTYLDGAAKTGLKSAKDVLDSSISALISSINTAIADGKTTASEKATWIRNLRPSTLPCPRSRAPWRRRTSIYRTS